ncbi:hypothetical protein K1719_011496 [Acacia pycnantha]|nr:hypothetical protein K1719_011496 [Acacia pycnantha]
MDLKLCSSKWRPLSPPDPASVMLFWNSELYMLVCPKKLTELRNYSTLVPSPHVEEHNFRSNPSLISPASIQCNGITSDDVASAPTFADIAPTVYELLHGLTSS